MRLRQLKWLTLVVALGCGDSIVSPDSSVTDTGVTTDTGTNTDAGMLDGSVADGAVDGGGTDGGNNACSSDPCMNGGTCSTTESGGYTCACVAGYSGEQCETNVDDCADSPCLNGGTCTDGVDSFTCECAVGYEGATCAVDTDDCATNPCMNGGTCTDAVGGYMCSCEAGFSGMNCDINIDDCAANPCMNGGTCTDEVNGFTCECAAGYEGAICDGNIDDCASNPCMNGGVCTDGIAGYTCECAAGYMGATCEVNVDDCAPNPCMNGGSCIDGVNSYMCSCGAGYSGPQCQNNIDDCAMADCGLGTCVDGVNSYSCTCPTGYSGTHCEVAPVRKSCLAILLAGDSHGDGDYTIDVDGSGPLAPVRVYCDMTTDGGGYTSYLVNNTGVSTNYRTQANSCQTLGMDLVVFRSAAHYNALTAHYNSVTYFRTVPGVYGERPGNYTTCAMNSNSDSACSRYWHAIDLGAWWIRDANYSEPNGDYISNAWLGTDGYFPHQRFNDGNANYATGTSYVCSTNDKGTVPVTAGLVAHFSAAHVASNASGVVSRWYDISGNDHHLSVARSAPVYQDNLINGHAALNFDGTDRGMSTAAFANSRDVTVFAVVQWRTPENWGNIAHHGNRDYDWSLERSGGTGAIHFQSANDNTGNQFNVAAGSNILLVGRISGTDRTFVGYSQTSESAVSATGNSMTAGSKIMYVGSSDVFEDSRAYIGEIVYYNRALTDTERDSVVRTLQARWDLDIPVSCAQILQDNPMATTGSYVIDPDGIGGNAPMTVTCDMTTMGGGWTVLSREDFEMGATGWNVNTTSNACTYATTVLGGYNVFGSGAFAQKTFDLGGVAHTQVRVALNYYSFDSWDGEQGFVTVEGADIFRQSFLYTAGTPRCGGGWNDRDAVAVDGVRAHTADTVVVRAGSGLDQVPTDESWGIDDVVVMVR